MASDWTASFHTEYTMAYDGFDDFSDFSSVMSVSARTMIWALIRQLDYLARGGKYQFFPPICSTKMNWVAGILPLRQKGAALRITDHRHWFHDAS